MMQKKAEAVGAEHEPIQDRVVVLMGLASALKVAVRGTEMKDLGAGELRAMVMTRLVSVAHEVEPKDWMYPQEYQ